jgi:hypothetical protein
MEGRTTEQLIGSLLPAASSPFFKPSPVVNVKAASITIPAKYAITEHQSALSTQTGVVFASFEGDVPQSNETVTITNLPEDSCDVPRSRGTGAHYANCCLTHQSAFVKWRDEMVSTIVPEVELEIKKLQSDLYGSKQECNGRLTYTSEYEQNSMHMSSSRDVFMSLQSRWLQSVSYVTKQSVQRFTSYDCTIQPDDCENLSATYYDNRDQLFKTAVDIQDIQQGLSTLGTKPYCKSLFDIAEDEMLEKAGCHVDTGDVHVYYSAPNMDKTQETEHMCGTIPKSGSNKPDVDSRK